jgi:hypothetical protein
MPWRPSTDATIQRESGTPLWAAISTLYDSTLGMDSLPRGNFERLKSFYVSTRKGDSTHVEELRAKVREVPQELALGPTEIALIDFILHYERGRVLRIVGPRGAGKTSLIHFIEFALQHANIRPTPMIIIANGGLLPKNASYVEILALIRDTLGEQVGRCSPDARPVLQAGVDVLTSDLSQAGLQAAARHLASSPHGSLIGYITIVFDNLDHHNLAVVERVVELAQQIYLASGLCCILCMRPGTRGYVSKQGCARAFFTYRMDIQTPSIDAWLASLPGKLASAATSGLVANGVDLTPSVLHDSFSRFADLLRNRRSDDNVVQILEAVSANDMRLLARLVRRILSHRSLPDRWLLNIDGDTPPDFHPLSSLIEAEHHLFKGDEDVPNLLVFEDHSGNTELLLPHRVLTMLDGSAYPVPTARLFRWLGELGYGQPTVTACLKMMMTALLVNSPDAEVIDAESPLPSEFGLTEAGQYYLHHLFHMTDYLALVVADVPLEHKRLREDEGVGFTGRLHSLLEYMEEVRRREDRQIAALASRPPSRELRRVADALSRGGLLTSALIDGVRDAHARGVHSRSKEVQQAAVDLRSVLANAERWLVGAEKRLQEVVNRGRRALHVPTTPLITSEEGLQVQLDLSTLGDELQMSAHIRTKELPDAAIVAVKSTAPSSQFSQAMLIVRQAEDNPLTEIDERAVLRGSFQEVGPDFQPTRADLTVQVVTVQKQADRVALLSADDVGSELRLRLYSAQAGHVEFGKLGAVADSKALRAWCVERLGELSALVASGRSVEDRLRIVGTELGKRMLSREGQKTLAALYKTIDTAIVYGGDPEIPWELMCPPPDGDALLPLLGSVWRVVRWPADQEAGDLSLALSDSQAPAAVLRTLGLGTQESWRWEMPESMSGLKDIARMGGTLHVVGHWARDVLRPLHGGTELDAQLIRAFGLAGPSAVILSACGAGAVERSSNLAIAIAMQARCVVWAPLVMIREEDADAIDKDLAAFVRLKPKAPVDDFMVQQRGSRPLLSLYARYGVSKAKRR